MVGFDHDTIRSGLFNETGSELMEAWGKGCSALEVRVKVEEFIKAVVDNFWLINSKYYIATFIYKHICLIIIINLYLSFIRARPTARRCRRAYPMDCGRI